MSRKEGKSLGESLIDHGVITAQQLVVKRLHNMGYMPIKIKEGAHETGSKRMFKSFKGVIVEDMMIFNVQLANMINSGLTLLVSLRVLAKRMENKDFKEIVFSVAENVKVGKSGGLG